MAHPCDGHTCDWCSICRSGRCCVTARTASSSTVLTRSEREALAEAMTIDALSHPTTATLMRLDVITPTLATTELRQGAVLAELVPGTSTLRPSGPEREPVVRGRARR